VDWDAHLEYAALTDVGMRRSNNQDSHAVIVAEDDRQWRDRGHLFLVADGMGAHAAGELASKMAADGVPHTYHKTRDLSAPEALALAIREMNATIHQRGDANPEFKGMGTTCSTLALLPEGAVVGHVGDSRVYRLRGEQLEQLSFDHSLIWELRSAADFDEAETVHLPKNIITRSLGPNGAVEVDLEGPFPLLVGDTFLLCSDGLTGELQDDELAVIMQCLPPAEACRLLVDLANLRGGPDNITAIIVRVTGEKLVGQGASGEGRPSKPSRRAAGFFWALAAISAAVAFGGFMAQYAPLLIVGGAATAGLLVLALAMQFAPHPPPAPPVVVPRKWGKGPHTSRRAVANAKFVAELAKVAGDLHKAGEEERWSVEWEKYDALADEGKRAAAKQDHAAAVRAYARSISYVMNELRANRPREEEAEEAG
jgi:protein phosphatase